MKHLVLLFAILISFNSYADEFSDAMRSYIREDYSTAFETFEKLAEQGQAKAQGQLGYMYYYGKGTTLNYKHAINWLTKAAKQGVVGSQYRLGLIYDNGDGVLQDYKQAFHWYTKAAEQGEIRAQNNLGLMYGEGKGVPKDYIKAHMLYNIASANGHPDAKINRDKIAKEMTPEQLAEARKLAREWMEKYTK